jgi:hypothetical protein
MQWINDNRAWLFEGVLVAIPVALIGAWAARRSGTHLRIRQKQKSGSHSKNLQIGTLEAPDSERPGPEDGR